MQSSAAHERAAGRVEAGEGAAAAPARAPRPPWQAPDETGRGQDEDRMPAAEPIVETREIEKYYVQPEGNRIEVIAPTNLAIYPEKILALLGPSGSGKSTLLRMMTGLVPPSAGEVRWHNGLAAGEQPNVSIVFQNFALFPWLTVLENVEAPLAARGAAAVERRKRAFKILDTVGLDGFETAFPKELSGGMKQRVGFARALVVEPDVLFMDEPFSALDVLTAENLRGELLELWTNRKMPTRAIFLVTHNIEEAVLLADRVVVLGRNPGRIRADFEVELPRPRDRKSRRFLELVDHIYKVLTQPDVEHAPPAGGRYPAARGTITYQMLPHARPGGIAGLLEILIDRGGKEDLYTLADELVMEVSDLLPIIEACTLLHFIQVQEGDVEITPEGKAFAEADILTRKSLFREASLRHVTLLKQISNALRVKSDRTLPDDFFSDILDEHFSAEEAEAQLSTAIHWGRYAEIFDYDAKSGRLLLTEGQTEQAEG
jgi:NitT/TauT family transport system ATP-binding protein